MVVVISSVSNLLTEGLHMYICFYQKLEKNLPNRDDITSLFCSRSRITTALCYQSSETRPDETPKDLSPGHVDNRPTSEATDNSRSSTPSFPPPVVSVSVSETT